MSKKNIIIISVLLILIIGTNVYKKGNKDVITVDCTKLKNGQISKQIILTGKFEYETIAPIVARESSIIKDLSVSKGAIVNKNQIIGLLDSFEIDQQIEKKANDLKIAKIEFEQNKIDITREFNKLLLTITDKDNQFKEILKLKESGAISIKDFQSSEREMKSLIIDRDYLKNKLTQYDNSSSEALKISEINNEIKYLKNSLKNFQISSPVSGKIISLAKKGTYAQKGESIIAEIANPDNLVINTKASEYEIILLSTGQDVEISIPNQPQLKLKGTIDFIDKYPQQENSNARYPIKIKPNSPETRSSKLFPGMIAELKITISGNKKAFFVPLSAIKKDNNNNDLVYYIDKNKKTHKLNVTQGFRNFEDAEISSPKLFQNMIIVIDPTKVKDNSSVKPKNCQ